MAKPSKRGPAASAPRRKPAPDRDGSARSAPRRPAKGRRRRRSTLGVLFRLGLSLTVVGIIAVAAVIAYYAATLPPRSEWAVPARPPNVAILSDDGELIANRGDTGGRAIRLDELPQTVSQALIAIEDRRYYSHFGIDPIGLARAMAANLKAGTLVQGGSTITQQLAKNLFLDPSRTIERKIQEMIFSVWLELSHTKEEILEMYLNRVYYGAGAYGIDAAAHRYFAKGAEDLELQEAALLAGVLKAPSYYGPTANLERANERAATVLRAMADAGFIDRIQEAYARANPATLVQAEVATSGGYVADWVHDVLAEYAGDVEGDVVVETTVDLELQELAQSALQELLASEGAEKGVSEGAVVVLDSGGAIKALVGGRQYEASQYNRAVDAARQPGSAFKPFVYLAALERGLTPQTIRVDQPIQIGDWSPENYSRDYKGPVTLTRALASSLNTVAVQLAMEVSPDAVIETARRLGMKGDLAPNASLALGTSEVTLLDLTAAYVPLSNGGMGVKPHVVRRIKTVDGRLLYERRHAGAPPVIALETVGAMNTMLSAALTAGTAQRAQLAGWPAAGKTGTSQNWRDAWFVGYTAFFTGGVWLGNDDNSPTDRTTGGSLPAALWSRLMANVHEGMAPADLPGLDAYEAQTLGAPFAEAQDPAWPGAASATTIAEPRTVVVEERGAGIGGFLRGIFGN